jgi:Outer membrane protein beta-barrel domain
MMKRIALVLAMVPALASAADIAPGTFELSGSTILGYNSTSQEFKSGGTTVQKLEVSNFALAGNGLYFVTPNLSVGARLGYLSQTTKDKTFGGKVEQTDLFIGPAAAYEVPVSPEVAVFGLLALGYQSSSVDFGGGSADGSGFGLNLEAGLKYFPVKSLSFDAALAYNYASLKYDSIGGVEPEESRSGFGFNVGLSVYFK